MGLFDIFKKKSRYDTFIEDCRKAVIAYEDDTQPSSADDLVNAIKKMTSDAKANINRGEIPPDQYSVLIYKLISNASFDLLTSGKYHIFRGMLNPMSCAGNLMTVHRKCLKYALENNMITEEQEKEDMDYLIEQIQMVG